MHLFHIIEHIFVKHYKPRAKKKKKAIPLPSTTHKAVTPLAQPCFLAKDTNPAYLMMTQQI